MAYRLGSRKRELTFGHWALLLLLSLAIAVVCPGLARADELPEGVLTITEDVWTPPASSIVDESPTDEDCLTAEAPEEPQALIDDYGDPAVSGDESVVAVADAGTNNAASPEPLDSGATVDVDKELGSTEDEPMSPAVDPESGGSRATDSIVVEITPGATREQLQTIISDADSRGVEVACNVVTDEDLSFGVVRFDVAEGAVVDDAINEIAQINGVVAVQRNYVYGPVGEVTSAEIYPELTSQLARTKVSDKLTNENWVADAVYSREAWDLVKSQGSLAVAVIDSGADLTHPDLKDNIVASYNAYDSSLSAEDTVGHGTHVAGIIAGVANNGLGLTGISYDAKLVIIKASTPNQNNFDTASIVRAYAWLLDEGDDGLTNAERYGVRVINMSIGGVDDKHTSNNYDDQIVKAMVRARDQGILTVCAAGNKGSSADPYFCYPGDSDACLSVINLQKNDDGSYDLSDTSNYNVPDTAYKDVCAPGTTIYSTWTEGRFAIQSGTSMAAPLVSGIAALMFAANPGMSPDLCMGLIEQSCTDLGDSGWDERFGYGMVNAEAAVRLANELTVVGPAAIGVGVGTHSFGIEGFSNLADESGWTWTAETADDSAGQAEVDELGFVSGLVAGDVLVRATCTTIAGAELTVERLIHVIDGMVRGSEALQVGESCTYTVADALGLGEGYGDLAWAWLIDEGTGVVTIDADGLVTAVSPGTVTVRAYNTTNSALTYSKKVLVAA